MPTPGPALPCGYTGPMFLSRRFKHCPSCGAAVEYRVPFWQIFTGLGNWPLFFRNLSVFGFYEGAKIRPASDGPSLPWMPALGGGLILNTVLGYQAPFGLRLEYARGLRSSYNGQDTLMLSFEM